MAYETILPLWKTALMASPESFGVMPADYFPRFLEKPFPSANAKAEAENLVKKKQKERQTLYYISVKNCHCTDFAFLESIATTFHRAKESGGLSPEGEQNSGGGEKIYLKGNSFLCGLAKAVLEQNEDEWIAACEKHGSEAYFEECAKLLTEQGWIFENAGEAEGESKSGNESKKTTKESWASLYNAIFLLTEEYLHTNGELPKLECNAISATAETPSETAANAAAPPSGENNLKIIFSSLDLTEEILSEARLIPIKPVPCSSDFLAIGAEFFDFLCKNFPAVNSNTAAGSETNISYNENNPSSSESSQNEFSMFMQKIYDEEVCKDLSWLQKAIASGTPPLPDFIGTAIMEPNKLGAYKNKKIYINHRLALDSLKHPQARFILLLAMLHEYGHFLDDILHEKSSGGLCSSQAEQCDSLGEEGENFASSFLELSPSNLFHSDFNFANFTAPDPKGNDKRFPLKIDNLAYEQRKSIICLFEFSERLENGSIILPTGEQIENAEFFGLGYLPSVVNKAYNAGNKTHQNLTKSGANYAKIHWTKELSDGSIWPDFPTNEELETNTANALMVLAESDIIDKLVGKTNKNIAYQSHLGTKQYWHSMCPTLTFFPTNAKVRELILSQLEKWYSLAIQYKKAKKIRESHFEIGKLCHTLQDSFVLSHCWRRYIGDEKFIDLPRIEEWEHGKIWSFEDYGLQDGGYHALADCPTQKNGIVTIGYKSAEEATKQILFRYSQNMEWEQGISGISSPKKYLEKMYEIIQERKEWVGGEVHPWFQKFNDFSRRKVQKKLTKFSAEIKE